MDKAASSRQVSKWETLDRVILERIFAKLNTRDLTKGASRVCISWFLASLNKTLWNTVDLSKPRQVDQGLGLRNIFTKIIEFLDIGETRRILRKVTKLSRSVPKNLFFGFDARVLEEDLTFAAVRMPNIEKLALPRWTLSRKNMRFAFSQWKNLTTLIISHDETLTGPFQFQAVGEKCSNLTNLKYTGWLDMYTAEQIVGYLKNIKRLSLRCSMVSYVGVLLLIAGLKNLTILNLSHCQKLQRIGHIDPVTIDRLVHAATRMKLGKFIVCSKNDCKVCKDRPVGYMWFNGPEYWCKYWRKYWPNDEIKEFEF